MEKKELIGIRLDNGKYFFYIDTSTLMCLRYEEDWRDFVGDNAFTSLYEYAFEQTAKVKELENLVCDLELDRDMKETDHDK